MAGFCGKCGAPRIEGGRFCTGCGADLSTMPVPCPTCGQPWVPPVDSPPVPVVERPDPVTSAPPVIGSTPVPAPETVLRPAPPGLPRGPALGEDYVPGQDCGNCGEPLQLRDGVCALCGSANTGVTFDPSLMS